MRTGTLLTLLGSLASVFIASTASATVHTFSAKLADHGGGYTGSTCSTGMGTFTYDDETHVLKGTIVHDLRRGYFYGVDTSPYSAMLPKVPPDAVFGASINPIGASLLAVETSLDLRHGNAASIANYEN